MSACATQAARVGDRSFDGVYDGRYGPAGGFCDQVGTHAARLVVRDGIGRLRRAGMGLGEGLTRGGGLRYRPEPIAPDGSFHTNGSTDHIDGRIQGDRFTAVAVQISGMPCNLSIKATKVGPGARLPSLTRNVLAPDPDSDP